MRWLSNDSSSEIHDTDTLNNHIHNTDSDDSSTIQVDSIDNHLTTSNTTITTTVIATPTTTITTTDTATTPTTTTITTTDTATTDTTATTTTTSTIAPNTDLKDEKDKCQQENQERNSSDLDLSSPSTATATTEPQVIPRQINNQSSTSATVEKDFKATSEALVRKLLERSTPRLDAKLVSVLLLEGMMDIFMAHISRTYSDSNDITLQNLSLEILVKHAQHERDQKDLDAIKRSYHAMEILCGASANHFWIQDAKFKVIITRLFDIFSPTSHGNFNHFAKIFQHFVRRHPSDMLDFIFLQDDKASLFFDYMLPYISESAVMDAALALIFVRDINAETKEKREKSHARLCELGLLQWLIKAIQIKDQNTAFSDAASQLLIRIVEETSQVDNGNLLLQTLDQPDQGGKELVASLVKLVVNQKPNKSRDLIIQLLRLLVKSGMLTTRASAISQPIHGPLYSISVHCQEMLSDYIPELCSVISNDRRSVSSKQLPLNVSDMALIEVIYLTLPNIRDKHELIDAIPTAFWKIVVNSFFEKRSSSIYHTLFYRIFCLILGLQYEPLTLVLIRRQKLVTRMIDVYEDKDQQSDTRGYILLMLNYLRLTTDAHPTGALYRIISDHPRFRAFLPRLRADTLAQINFNYSWKLDSCPRPPIHIGPSPPVRSPPYSSYTPTLQLTTGGSGETEDSHGIDLGSDYAYCLGFDQTCRTEDGYETPMGNLSRRTSLHSISSSDSLTAMDSNNNGFDDFLWGESLTADEPSDNQIKKKKKKKVFISD